MSFFSNLFNKNKKRCLNCNSVVNDKDTFCSKCGVFLDNYNNQCPNCLKNNSINSNYCKYCGEKLIIDKTNDKTENIINDENVEEFINDIENDDDLENVLEKINDINVNNEINNDFEEKENSNLKLESNNEKIDDEIEVLDFSSENDFETSKIDNCDNQDNIQENIEFEVNKENINNILDSYYDKFFDSVRKSGQSYFRRNKVIDINIENNVIYSKVSGTEIYNVEVNLKDKENFYSCTCPCNFPCKHVYATILKYKRMNIDLNTFENSIYKLDLINEYNFDKLIKKLIDEGKNNQSLSYKYICNQMSEEHVNKREIDKVLELLMNNDITIIYDKELNKKKDKEIYKNIKPINKNNKKKDNFFKDMFPELINNGNNNINLQKVNKPNLDKGKNFSNNFEDILDIGLFDTQVLNLSKNNKVEQMKINLNPDYNVYQEKIRYIIEDLFKETNFYCVTLSKILGRIYTLEENIAKKLKLEDIDKLKLFIKYEYPDYFIKGNFVSKYKDPDMHDMIVDKMKDYNIVDHKDILDFFNSIGYDNHKSYDLYFSYLLSSDFIQIDVEKVIKKEIFNFEDETISKIKKTLNFYFSDRNELNLSKNKKFYLLLPKIEYEWNVYVLKNIIELYLKNNYIVTKNNDDYIVRRNNYE